MFGTLSTRRVDHRDRVRTWQARNERSGPGKSGHLLWWPPHRLRNRRPADPAGRRHPHRRPGRLRPTAGAPP